MTNICVPIREKTSPDIQKEILRAKKSGADMVEIWLGEVEKFDFSLITDSPLPVVVNCKNGREKGGFTGSDQEKKVILLQAIQAGATYVDVSGNTESENIQEICEKKEDSKIILSQHYFRGTPGLPQLTSDMTRLLEYSPDVLKYAAQPHTFKDVVTMIRLAEKMCAKHIPHIVISMGKIGKVTRLSSPVLRNEIMFAPIDTPDENLLGQVSVADLRTAFDLFE